VKQIKTATIFFSLLISSLTPGMQEVRSVIAEMQRLHTYSTRLFVRAAWTGDLASVKALAPYVDVSSRIDIEEEAREQVSALHMSSYMGHTEIVRFLLKQCDINPIIEDINGSTPLHEACSEGHAAVVELLLRNGAQKIINQYDKLLDTPLTQACRYGHVDVVETLIRAHADVRIPGWEGNLPIHQACESGNLAMVQAVLKVAPTSIHARNQGGSTPLRLASSRGHEDAEHEEVMLFLIARCRDGEQEDINAQDGGGITPLWIASSKGHANGVDALLKAKADVTIPDHQGYFPLHIACQEGRLNIAKKLVTLAPATINAPNKNGDTPLHLASSFDNHLLAICLIHHKANPNIKNKNGCTALDCAKNDVMRGGLKTGELVIGPSPELDAFMTPIMERFFAQAAPAWPPHRTLQDEDAVGPEEGIEEKKE